MNWLRSNRSKVSTVLMVFVLAGVSAVAARKALASDDCCAAGAACCKPGAPCCHGKDHPKTP